MWCKNNPHTFNRYKLCLKHKEASIYSLLDDLVGDECYRYHIPHCFRAYKTECKIVSIRPVAVCTVILI